MRGIVAGWCEGWGLRCGCGCLRWWGLEGLVGGGLGRIEDGWGGGVWVVKSRVDALCVAAAESRVDVA
jgi:hypothetical protein